MSKAKGGFACGQCFPSLRFFLAHRIDVIRAGKAARPDLFRVALDRLFDGGAEFAETLHEFRHPRRKAEHILQHKDLTVTRGIRADTDGRDCDLSGDAARQRFGDRFQHHGERA